MRRVRFPGFSRHSKNDSERRGCAKRRHSLHQTYHVEGDYGLEEALELEPFDRIPPETRPPGRRNAGSGRLGVGVAFVPVQLCTFLIVLITAER